MIGFENQFLDQSLHTTTINNLRWLHALFLNLIVSGFPICTPSIALMRIKTWNNTLKYFQVLLSTLKIKVDVLRVANILEGIIFLITMYKLCAGARNTTVFPRKKHASKKPTGWGKKQYRVVFFLLTSSIY